MYLRCCQVPFHQEEGQERVQFGPGHSGQLVASVRVSRYKNVVDICGLPRTLARVRIGLAARRGERYHVLWRHKSLT